MTRSLHTLVSKSAISRLLQSIQCMAREQYLLAIDLRLFRRVKPNAIERKQAKDRETEFKLNEKGK